MKKQDTDQYMQFYLNHSPKPHTYISAEENVWKGTFHSGCSGNGSWNGAGVKNNVCTYVFKCKTYNFRDVTNNKRKDGLDLVIVISPC